MTSTQGTAAAAADHLARSLELIDPDADRWVLVEALEALARLLVAAGRPGAVALLDFSSAVRAAIHQPPAPTEQGDLDMPREPRHAMAAHEQTGLVLSACRRLGSTPCCWHARSPVNPCHQARGGSRAISHQPPAPALGQRAGSARERVRRAARPPNCPE